MKGWLLGVGMAVALVGAPAVAHKEKRTDPCGCHHQWGLRHCHPKEKTERCEAPAAGREKASEQEATPDQTPAPGKAVRAQAL